MRTWNYTEKTRPHARPAASQSVAIRRSGETRRRSEFARVTLDPLRAAHIEVGSRCPMSDAPPTFDDLGTLRDVTASGVRLRVLERGNGPKLVLLHSLFMD